MEDVFQGKTIWWSKTDETKKGDNIANGKIKRWQDKRKTDGLGKTQIHRSAKVFLKLRMLNIKI